VKIILLLISTCFISLGSTNTRQKPYLYVKTGCSFHFEKDLKSNPIKLFLIGGIAPTYIKGQEEYEKKFNLRYHYYGCIPEAEACSKSYSLRAFKHLDQKYGKSWRNYVRKDVLYLSEK
jgi:hypothetical protein